MRRRRSRRRDFTRLYILIAVMVAALAGVFAANLFGEEENQQAAESGLTVESNFSHIMVMGVDRRSDDVGRSDTLMVVTVDTDAGKGEIMSLPRDTRVQIEKNGYDKMAMYTVRNNPADAGSKAVCRQFLRKNGGSQAPLGQSC